MTEGIRYKTILFFIVAFISSISIGHLSAEKIFDTFIKELGAKNVQTQDEIITRPTIEYKAEGLRDPFQYGKAKEGVVVPQGEQAQIGVLPSLIIQGIIWGGRFPQAIINNKVVKIGDTIEEVSIMDINQDGVTVLVGSQPYKLSSPAAINLYNLENPQGGKDED